MAGLHASRLSLVRVASVRGCSHCYYSGRSSKQANPPADRSWLKPTLRPALKTFLQFASRDSITWERRRSSHKPVVAQPQPDELCCGRSAYAVRPWSAATRAALPARRFKTALGAPALSHCIAQLLIIERLPCPRSETGYALSAIEVRLEVAFLAMDAFQESSRSGGVAEIEPM